MKWRIVMTYLTMYYICVIWPLSCLILGQKSRRSVILAILINRLYTNEPVLAPYLTQSSCTKQWYIRSITARKDVSQTEHFVIAMRLARLHFIMSIWTQFRCPMFCCGYISFVVDSFIHLSISFRIISLALRYPRKTQAHVVGIEAERTWQSADFVHSFRNVPHSTRPILGMRQTSDRRLYYVMP